MSCMQQLTGTKKTKHIVIGKLTAIVGHCELMELEAESQQGKERLERIKSLALDIAEMVHACAAEHYERPEEHEQLTVL